MVSVALVKLRSVTLTINGETKNVTATTLAALITELGMKSDRVAVELNCEIVPRSQWEQAALNDGDKLEIVHFVGGGSSLHSADSSAN